MIFDIYLDYCFDSGGSAEIPVMRFRDQKYYEGIAGVEVYHRLEHGYITCMHRRSFVDSFAEVGNNKLWIFGYAFTTELYAGSQNIEPCKLTATDVLNIINKNPDNFFDLIKGSFVLILLNEREQSIKIIPDRLNVLPVYYAFDGNQLIISSNTAMILKAGWVNKEPDLFALTMQSLFDYMLGEYYFFKGIRRCENGRTYFFSKSGLKKEVWWDVKQLYHEKLLPKKESLDLLAEQHRKNVRLYSSDAEKILIALTGGFDGRTNLAVLERPAEKYLCYSYGMPGSRQISVPQEIAGRLGINYQPVFLEQDFLNSYYENTILATYFSNGTAPVGFCNKPYSYSKLNDYSDVILTGLFGSEILRPLHNTGIIVNDNSFDIFLSECLEDGIRKAINKSGQQLNYSNLPMSELITELANYFKVNYFEKYNGYDKITIFFFFIIQEGIRKYFSQEISLERVFVTTRFPYFDTDLVDLIYKTPWAGMYNGFLGESKFKRRKGQLLYAQIMKKYKPQLGSIKLDRGYKPDDLLLPFPINFLKIWKGVLDAKKFKRSLNGNDTFKTEIWAIPTLRQIAEERDGNYFSISNLYFNEALVNGSYTNNYLTFRHMASIKAFNDILST